jgi:hypothetical protein
MKSQPIDSQNLNKTMHGAFLERNFEMKESISTFCWDRLGTPPRFKIYDF